MVAHNIPYVAQTTPYHWKDLSMKVEKALACEGPAFLNILMPCTVGWHFDPALGIDIAREAVETNYWPLFEVENGVYKVNKKPKDRAPIEPWLKKQGRFKHLFLPGQRARGRASAAVDRQRVGTLAEDRGGDPGEVTRRRSLKIKKARLFGGGSSIFPGDCFELQPVFFMAPARALIVSISSIWVLLGVRVSLFLLSAPAGEQGDLSSVQGQHESRPQPGGEVMVLPAFLPRP